MTGLRAELARVGIRGRLANRIAAELDDHLACDPEAHVGEPRLIAERFAEELRLPKTRRATHLGFAGLVLTALLLGSLFGGSRSLPGTTAVVVPFAGLAIVLGAQVSFVGGMLALWGARRSTAPAIVQRRLTAALAGGLLVLAAEGVDAVALHSWPKLLALAPAPLLVASAAELRTAVGITPARAAASRGFGPPAVWAVGGAVVAFVLVGSAFAEHSWNEGVTRAAIEGLAFAAGFLLLGRRLGIRR